MDPLQALLGLLLIVAPIGVYFWRDQRNRDPRLRWPKLAPLFSLEFTDEPPSLSGSWKGREVALQVQEDGSAMVSARVAAQKPLRLEIGDRAAVERAAGMVVPDRVEFSGRPDGAFSGRFLVRATPLEMGEFAVDHSIRSRLVQLPSVHVLGTDRRLDLTVPPPTEEDALREYLDIAVALADALEQA